jgi:MFS family permease
MLRSFSLSLMMVFVPFYLYQNGYSAVAVFLFFGFWFTARAFADIMAAYFVARFGPKHSMLVSCLFQIMNAALLLTLPSYHWPLWMIALVGGIAASLFFIAYHVEFSKIKHTPHAGKELGSMQVFEKTAAVVGPLAGGLAATFLGSRAIFAIGCITLLISLVPLFRTAEPVRTGQTLRFRDLPLKTVLSDIRAGAGIVVENTLCLNLWPFYIALFALGGGVYVQLGALTSLAMLTSIFSAHVIGRYIDTKNARSLLRLSATVNTLIYLVRPFVRSLWPAFAVGIANEVVTTGYRMPFMKGMYAAADDLPGFRIVYLTSIEFIGDVLKAAVWYFLAIVAVCVTIYSAFFVGFLIAAVASLLIMTEKFRALGSRPAL